MSCTEHRGKVNGVNLCWFEWGRDHRDRGTILLVHATGFHARCWDATVAHLRGQHVIAVDMRGHGRSDKTPPYTWDIFGQDLAALVREMELKCIVGVGHSMGGHSLTQAAAAEPSRFDHLVLVDPVILSPLAYAAFAGAGNPQDHPVSRRRSQFDSVEAMVDNLAGRGGFALWEPAVLKDYCRYGLLPNPDGPGLILACPPLVEAAVYAGSAGTNILDLVEQVAIPVTILRAPPRDPDHPVMDFSKSPTWPELADHFQKGTDVYLPELTHFIPMQAPRLVAGHILKYAQATSSE
ncbi:MAG: alpha/beta hydrolase [Pseudomonadales bacterium]